MTALSPDLSTARGKNPSRILVVDDQPINIKLLQRKLEREGFAVLTAYNGRECLSVVESEMPDLILLDVMMPEMDGIETCERLKQNEKTKAIPIIFITAKSSKEGKLEGLNVGATDYITKPIDLEETMARVKTQLRIQKIYRENIDLQTRLGEARRTAAVGAITQGIAHNLNNLLGVAVGYLDLLKNGYDSPDMVKRSTNLMDQAIQRMVHIVRQLSTIATSEQMSLTPVLLSNLLTNSIDRFHDEYDLPKAEVSVQNPLPTDFVIHTNPEVFESVIGKLLINAYEAYRKEAKSNERPVLVRVEFVDGEVEEEIVISIRDNGLGIDEEVRETLFEPFITSKTSVGRGLGLTMARHAVKSLGGNMDLVEQTGGGTAAIVRLPHIRQLLGAGGSQSTALFDSPDREQA